MIFVIKLKAPQREALTSDNLPLIFFNLLWLNLSKFSQLMKICSAYHLKAEKNRGYKGSFLAICNFVFSSSTSNLVL